MIADEEITEIALQLVAISATNSSASQDRDIAAFFLTEHDFRGGRCIGDVPVDAIGSD